MKKFDLFVTAPVILMLLSLGFYALYLNVYEPKYNELSVVTESASQRQNQYANNLQLLDIATIAINTYIDTVKEKSPPMPYL